MSLSVHSSNGVRETSSFTYFVYRTPLGRITLASDGEALTQMAFGVAEFKGEYRPCALTNQASSEVLEYLAKSVKPLLFLFILKVVLFKKRFGIAYRLYRMDKQKRMLKSQQI